MTRIVCDVLDMMMANLLLLTWYLSLGWATPGIGYNQEYLIRLSPCKPADCIMNLVLKKYALHVHCKSTTSLHKCFCCKSWEKYEEDSNWDFPHGFTISYAWWFLFQKALTHKISLLVGLQIELAFLCNLSYIQKYLKPLYDVRQLSLTQ